MRIEEVASIGSIFATYPCCFLVLSLECESDLLHLGVPLGGVLEHNEAE